MRDALNKTGRKIYYSMSDTSSQKPYLWANTVSNSWRTSGGNSDNWGSVLNNLDQQVGL